MFIKKIKKIITRIIKKIFIEEFEKNLILKGKLLSSKNKKIKKIKDLSDVEFRIFSQWGEDGIIDWIISQIPGISKNFLEIGTEDYQESNTRFLLINRNWDGFLIDGDQDAIKKIKSQRLYWKYNLKAFSAFLTTKNINKIISDLKLPKKIGLISLDIDGVDYWILKKIKKLNPTIFICEYNSIFGINKCFTVPDKEKFLRKKEHYSNLYYGASIKAFIDLLKDEYIFLGTNSSGNNAFFIKKEHKKFIKNKIRNYTIFESKFRESRNYENKLTYLNKKKSRLLLKNKDIIDLNKKEKLKFKNIQL